MMKEEKDFIPALGSNWITGFYDRVISWTMPEKKFRTKLIQQLSPLPNEEILEFGFGTAQNLIYALKAEKKTHYYGLDIDPEVKTIAEEKLKKRNLLNQVQLVLYNGNKFPYPENSFDKVFSCLVFHQLDKRKKNLALKEIYRVLKPKGMALICDWGKPSNFFYRMGFLLVQLLDGFKTTSDNRKGLLPQFLKNAGFNDVEELGFVNTHIGTIRYLVGTK